MLCVLRQPRTGHLQTTLSTLLAFLPNLMGEPQTEHAWFTARSSFALKQVCVSGFLSTISSKSVKLRKGIGGKGLATVMAKRRILDLLVILVILQGDGCGGATTDVSAAL